MENKTIQNSEELQIATYLKERERYERLELRQWVNNILQFFALIILVASGGASIFCGGNLGVAFGEEMMLDNASKMSSTIWIGYTLLSFLFTGFGVLLCYYLAGIQKIRDLGLEKCQEMVDLVAKDEDVKRYRDAVVEKGSELLFFDLLKARQIVDLKTRLNESENVRAVCKKAHGLN